MITYKKFTNNLNRVSFVLPALLLIGFFTGYPLVFSIINSFKKYRLNQPDAIRFIGFDNYITVFKDPLFLAALLRSIGLTVVIVGIQLIIGLFIAVILSRSFRGHGIIRSIIVLPIATTPVVVGLTWKFMFMTPSIGIINHLLDKIGISGPIWLADPLWSLIAIIIMDVWNWTPFMVIILLAGILNQPKDIYEAALVDGANNFKVTTKITIPLLKKVMGVILLIRIADSFRMFDQIWMLTEGGPGTSTQTLAVLTYQAAFNYSNLGRASAISMVMLVILITFLIIMLKKIDLLEDS